MANKKLAGDQLQKFKSLVLEGKTPEEIKDIFGISVSSVHNYKRKLKEQGLDIPDVRGQRPSDVAPKIVTPLFEAPTIPDNAYGVEFVVNDITIQITGKAKVVNVSGNRIHIEI